MGVKITAQPIAEPLTIEECRLHLNVDPLDIDVSHPDDAMIMALQGAAREWCEDFSGLSLAVKTYEMALDVFPNDEIRLPSPPIVEVVSIKYLDTDFVEQILPNDQYTIDSYQRPGWVMPAYGTNWPATAPVANAVKITYRSGFAVPGDDVEIDALPFVERAAMCLVMGHLYRNRETTVEKALTEIPYGAEALLRPRRVLLGMA